MERYFKFSELSKLEQQMYYNYIYLFLMEANMQYPAFSAWYGNLFTDDMRLKPEREIIVCEKEYEIAGVTEGQSWMLPDLSVPRKTTNGPI